MISCPNCGGLNPEGSGVCGNCGTNLVSNQNNDANVYNPNNNVQANTPIVDINYDESFGNVGIVNNNVAYENANMNANQNMTNNEFNIEPNYEDVPINNNVPNTIDPNVVASDEEDVFTDAFIGKNVNKIKNVKFSIWAFLFSSLYLWYRKMYKLFGIVFGFSLISSLLFSILNIPFMSYVVSIGIGIVLGIKFKDLYLKHVYTSVDKIKNNNSDKTPEEVINICSKKGGTTIIPIIVGIVLGIVIPIALVLMAMNSTKGYVDTAKKDTMIDDARNAIEVVRNDVVTNGLKESSKTYTIDDLNNILEKQLITSPYNNNYTDVKVQVMKMMNDTYMYKICMIDEGGNGFGYTYENELNKDIVMEGNAPSSCD